MKKLESLDIAMSIFNQEHLIEAVLDGIFKNTITPFNLILVFDGCTDTSEAVVQTYLRDRRKFPFLRKLTITQTPNVYETRANNVALRLATEEFVITLQDDMVINEYGWEKRLSFPLRKFDDVFAVTARTAHDVVASDEGKELYEHTADRVLGLPRNVFAVRDIINRGPVAFVTARLKKLNYLNEQYAPCNLDDADICLRAWTQYQWKCGTFSIAYISDTHWGKARSKDSTMPVLASNQKNVVQLQRDHRAYLQSGKKHSINYRIEDSEIQETDGFSPPQKKNQWLYRRMVTVAAAIGLYRFGVALLRACRRIRFLVRLLVQQTKAQLRGRNTPDKTAWTAEYVTAYATQAVTKRRLQAYIQKQFAK